MGNVGYSFVRNAIRLGATLSFGDRLRLYQEFGVMMVRAVDFDPAIPEPIESDPYVGGLFDDE